MSSSSWKVRAWERAALGVAVGLVLGFCATMPMVLKQTKLTQSQADAALHWVSQRIPNTRFISATPNPDVPGLIDLRADGSVTSMYFDPQRHYLMLGLVINMDNQDQVIAPGRLVGASQ